MPDAEALPERVRSFLSSRIERYEDLQVLLFLRARRGEWWSSHAMAERLRDTLDELDDALERLLHGGLIEADTDAAGPRYRFGGCDDTTATIVEELARACLDQSLMVVKLMTTNALERLRARSVLTFSQALAARARLR
jgi:hypothetical protein